MKYQWTIILIGIITIIFPFLHLPLSWEVILQIVLGIMLILTGVAIQQSRKSIKKKSSFTTGHHPVTSQHLHTPLAILDDELHTHPIDPEDQLLEERDDGEIFS